MLMVTRIPASAKRAPLDHTSGTPSGKIPASYSHSLMTEARITRTQSNRASRTNAVIVAHTSLDPVEFGVGALRGRRGIA